MFDIEAILEVRRKKPPQKVPQEVFHHSEDETDFYARANVLLQRFFHQGEKKEFIFAHDYKFGKTTFWSYIYIYYRAQGKIIDDKWKYRLNLVKHLSEEQVGDYSEFNRTISKLKHCYVNCGAPPKDENTPQYKDYKRNRNKYLTVRDIWNKCLE